MLELGAKLPQSPTRWLFTGDTRVAEKWLAIASVVLISACGPREITFNEAAAMTDEEKKIACRDAWELWSQPAEACNAIEVYDDRQRCLRKVQWLKNKGLMNYVVLNCTRVKFHE